MIQHWTGRCQFGRVPNYELTLHTHNRILGAEGNIWTIYRAAFDAAVKGHGASPYPTFIATRKRNVDKRLGLLKEMVLLITMKKVTYEISREDGAEITPSYREFYSNFFPDILTQTSDTQTWKLQLNFLCDEDDNTIIQAIEDVDELLETAVQVILFQTAVRLRWTNENVIDVSISSSYSIHGSFPLAFPVQNLLPEVKRQLHLWFIASETTDFVVQIILYYQIVEISHPDLLPAEFHECRHLRNIVAHSGDMTFNSLKTYCTSIGLDAEMLNRNNPTSIRIVSSKVEVVRSAARRMILQGMNLPA